MFVCLFVCLFSLLLLVLSLSLFVCLVLTLRFVLFHKPCIVMVEEVDRNNLYISVASPNLNFNITRDLETGGQVNGQERFYSISEGIEVEV